MTPQEWADDWMARNPNWDRDVSRQQRSLIDDHLSKTLKRGCVGLTCVELGLKGLGIEWPDMKNCYKTLELAQARMTEMIAKHECKGTNCNHDPAKPRIYSIHFRNDRGKRRQFPDARANPTTGKIDLTNWDPIPRPNLTPKEDWVNFDYGYLNSDGMMVHANHGHKPEDPNTGPMKVYFSTVDEWKVSNTDFNDEVWCVACEQNKAIR